MPNSITSSDELDCTSLSSNSEMNYNVTTNHNKKNSVIIEDANTIAVNNDKSRPSSSSSSIYIQDHSNIVKKVTSILNEVDSRSNDKGGLWGLLIDHDIGFETNEETGEISQDKFIDSIRSSVGHAFDSNEMKIIITSFSDYSNENTTLLYKEMAAFCEVKRKPKEVHKIAKIILQYVSKHGFDVDYTKLFSNLDENGDGWISNSRFYETILKYGDEICMSHEEKTAFESFFGDGEMIDYISVSSYVQSCDVERSLDLLNRAITNIAGGHDDEYEEQLTIFFYCLEKSCQDNGSDIISSPFILAQALDKIGILLNQVQIDSIFDVLCESELYDPKDFVEMIQEHNKVNNSLSVKRFDDKFEQVSLKSTKFHDKASFRGAFRLAFDFCDKDNNGTITRKEFEDLLWAIGLEPERSDIMELWSSAPKNKSEVNFKQLLDITLPYLKKKLNSLTKLKEAQLRTLFDKYDIDGNGCISWNEFQSIFVKEMQSLDTNEARAIFNEIDADRNGEISFHEFKGIFTIEIPDILEDIDNDHMVNIEVTSSNNNGKVYSTLDFAIRKARYWSTASMSPISFLQAFIGLPASFRPSLIQPLDMIYEHSLQSTLTPTHDHQRGIGVKDLDVSFVSQEKDHRRNVTLQPTSVLKTENTDLESEFIQLQIELQTAKGVPKPHDLRIEDVIERSFRVILFKNDSKLPAEQRWIGNSYRALALQDSIRRDKWTFPSLGGVYFDNKFLVRINKDQPIKNVYILIELTITIRSIKEDLNQKNEEKQGQKSSFDEREISCCWCTISLHDVIELSTTNAMNLTLHGGSPFSTLDINMNENSHSPKFLNLFSMRKNQIKSQLDLSITPFKKISKAKRYHINYLPRALICPMNWIAIIHIYRELVAEALYYASNNDMNRTLAPGHYGAISEPLLATFPKISSDAALTRLFCWLWQENCSKKGERKSGMSTSRMSRDVIRQLLHETVCAVWFASNALTKTEFVNPLKGTCSETDKRFEFLKSIASDDKISCDNASYNDVVFAPFNTSEVAFFLHY